MLVRCMGRISLLCLSLSLLISVPWAQVLPANEIKDPELRALQERNMDDLKKLGADILAFPTDYPFYLSRKLDLDQAKQKWADQRSIQFDRYKGKIVLPITGNYFAAYSAEKMNSDQRRTGDFFAHCRADSESCRRSLPEQRQLPGVRAGDFASRSRQSWRSRG